METQERPQSWSAHEGEPAEDVELTDKELEGVTGGLVRVYIPGQEAKDEPEPSTAGSQPPGPR